MGHRLKRAGVVAALVAAGCVAALAAGCASSPASGLSEADRHLAAGDYRQAAEAYGARLAAGGPGVDRALLQLAVIHSLPDSPLRDPARAGELLRRLEVEFPDSPLRPTGRLLRALEADRHRRAAEAEALRRRLGELRTELDRACLELDAAETARAAAETHAVELRQEVALLASQLSELEAALGEERLDSERLAEELRRLKAIDLGSRP